MVNLITEHINIWTAAQTQKTNGGRGRVKNSNGQSLHGIKKLCELILELAVRGKLVPQDPSDEPASDLLKKIAKEKARLIKEGKIKKQKPLPEITEDEKPFELPEGWEWVRLGDIGETNIGLTYSPKDISDIGTPVLRANNVQNGKLDLTDLVRVNKAIKNSVIVQEGDLLICARSGSRALVGKTAQITNLSEEMAFGAFMAIFRSRINNYVLYLINSPLFRRMIDDVNTTTINQITQNNLKTTIFSFPPLTEQHRIVAKVDELMALCDQLEQQQTGSNAAHQNLVETLLSTLTTAADQGEFAKAWQRIANHFDTLFTTEQSIDHLKQTILQLAVMGKLVPQDPKDEPASILLKKIAKEKARLIKEGKIKKQKQLPEITEEEKPFELPMGWALSRLGEFTVVGTGATPTRGNPNYYFPEEVNWVTSGETSDEFITETKEKISLLAVSKSNVTIYPIGTLIVAMYGQGKTRGQVSELLLEAGTNQACAAIQPVDSAVHHRKYIKLFLKKAYEELRSHAAGGAQPNLNVGKVTQTVIPLPPLAEQHRIVAKVDELMALCDSLKARLNDAQTTQIQLADAIVEQAVV